MKNTVKPVRIKFFLFLLRLIPAFLFVALFFYFIAPFFINAHLKLFKNELELLHPEYEILSGDIIKFNQLDYVQFLINVNKTPTLAGSPAHKGDTIRIKAQASTLCVAPIIIFSLILAWPGIEFRKRLKAILIAVPLMIVLAGLDYPVIFISDIESVYSDAPILNNIGHLWKHLMNNGGRQFLALMIFSFSLFMASKMPKKKEYPDKKVGRNDPCPCGSGLKYKHCCLRQ